MRDNILDLFELESLLTNGLYNDCDKTYINTNERLGEILPNFNFKDKEVLSVLSSGDHVFSAYYLGAKNVDTFDINYTTYYYFYLKKWYMMYYYDCVLSTLSDRLNKSLIKYDKKCNEEKKAKEVWEELLINRNNINNLFLDPSDTPYVFNLPYSKNMKELVNIIKDKKANFTEQNITGNLRINKKYDIIILSNILESIVPNSINEEKLCNNLLKLVKEDGIIICSILNDRYNNLYESRKMFDKYFISDISDIKRYNNRLKKEVPIYYTYLKRK